MMRYQEKICKKFRVVMGKSGPFKGCLSGQVSLELTFTIALMVMIFGGIAHLFHWQGKDLYKRRRAHERVLLRDSGRGSLGPLYQVRTTFYYADEDLGQAQPSDIFR